MKKRIKAWQIVVAVPVILFSIIMIASGFSLISDGETGSGVFGIVIGFFCILPAAAVLILPIVLKKNRKADAESQVKREAPPAPIARVPESNEQDTVVAAGHHDTQAITETPESSIRMPVSFSVSFEGLDGKRLARFPSDYFGIDVETTGLNPQHDRITEIAAVKVESGRIVDRFSSLVYSEVPIPPNVEQITGISNEMLSDAPTENEIIPRFLEYINYRDVVGYNVGFDIRFLKTAAERCGDFFCSDYFDVLPLAKKCLPDLKHYSLEDIARRLDIPVPVAHRALADAETTILCASALRSMISPEEKKRVAIENYDFSKIQVDYDTLKPTVDSVDPQNPLYGKRIVFTGELLSMTRAEACQYVVNHGGIAADKVTKGTSFLVVGDAGFPPNTDEAGSGKMKKADEWRSKGSAIQNITEADFFKMVSEYEKAKGN